MNKPIILDSPQHRAWWIQNHSPSQARYSEFMNRRGDCQICLEVVSSDHYKVANPCPAWRRCKACNILAEPWPLGHCMDILWDNGYSFLGWPHLDQDSGSLPNNLEIDFDPSRVFVQ